MTNVYTSPHSPHPPHSPSSPHSPHPLHSQNSPQINRNSEASQLTAFFNSFFESDQTLRRRQLKGVINELMTRENHRQTFHHLMSIALEIYERRWLHVLSFNQVDPSVWTSVISALDQFHGDWLFQMDVQASLLMPTSNSDEFEKSFAQFKLDLIQQRRLRDKMMKAAQTTDRSIQQITIPEVDKIIPAKHESTDGTNVLQQLAELVGTSKQVNDSTSLYDDNEVNQLSKRPFTDQEIEGMKNMFLKPIIGV
eukprot:GHVN01017522.1.p1 GENE.GHVN01017522.1~~GHVN01017522.1.p1  ORF type:complete len:262 (-),score=68.34 GHVN01017522.1:1135-1890(-)